MNLSSALGTHRFSFTFTKDCLVSLYFPRWLLWFRKKCVQLHNTKAKSCLLSPCSKASVPIPWGPGSSSLFRGSASPMLGTHGTSHGAGRAEWGWCRARDYTKRLACAQPRKQHLGCCVWSDDALGLGVMVGWGSPLLELASPTFLPTGTPGVSPRVSPWSPSLCSWDHFENRCITGCEVLRCSGKEGCVSTSTKWVYLSSHHSDLQSSLPRETSCSSAIYDPPLNLPSLWLNPQALKCAAYWHLYSTFHTLPLKAFYKAMNYIPVNHWIHSSKKEAVITHSAISLITPPAIEFVCVHQRDKVTLMPSLLLVQQRAREGKDKEKEGKGSVGGSGCFSIPRCEDVAYINFLRGCSCRQVIMWVARCLHPGL